LQASQEEFSIKWQHVNPKSDKNCLKICPQTKIHIQNVAKKEYLKIFKKELQKNPQTQNREYATNFL
jgi:Fe-S-cluster-containing hydrogenase component 2